MYLKTSKISGFRNIFFQKCSITLWRLKRVKSITGQKQVNHTICTVFFITVRAVISRTAQIKNLRKGYRMSVVRLAQNPSDTGFRQICPTLLTYCNKENRTNRVVSLLLEKLSKLLGFLSKVSNLAQIRNYSNWIPYNIFKKNCENV
jgi:hypothetical protein